MMLTVRVALFVLTFVSLKVGQQRFGVLSRLGISGGQAMLILLVAYAGLLTWEIAEGVKLKRDVRGVRRGGFVLSFVVGGTFGMIGAYTGNPGTVSLGLLAGNFIGAGAILGLIGALLSGAIVKAVRSRDTGTVGEPPAGGGRTGRA